MPYTEVIRACGHKETIWVSSEREMKSEATRKAHEAELCEDCYVINNRVRELKVSYDEYKRQYGQYRTKANSYNAGTIVVYVPEE